MASVLRNCSTKTVLAAMWWCAGIFATNNGHISHRSLGLNPIVTGVISLKHCAGRYARRVVSLVHNVSPRGSAEPDRSRTPTNLCELGGSDREGEAQSLGEHAHPPLPVPSSPLPTLRRKRPVTDKGR